MSYTMTTPSEVATHDPTLIAPPILLDNSPSKEQVGAAHGRVLPLVGNTRPYVYDVVFDNKSQRVYADDPMDVLAVILGEPYQDAVQRFRTAIAAQDDTARITAIIDMMRIRHAHADTLRVQLQQTINAQAQQDGTWEDLDEEERQVLTGGADPDGGYPVGIIEEGPAIDDDGNELIADHNRWAARVPLVVATGDYAPFSGNVGVPESVLTEPLGGYEHVVIPGDVNLVYLNSMTTDDEESSADDAYLESLAAEAVNVIQLTLRPVEQPDPMFQTIT